MWSSPPLTLFRPVNVSGNTKWMALAFVKDNDWFALLTLLMQDCFSNDRRHSCRTCISATPKRPDIKLRRAASPNPLIIKCYLKKSKNCDKKNVSGIKRQSRCAYLPSDHNVSNADQFYTLVKTRSALLSCDKNMQYIDTGRIYWIHFEINRMEWLKFGKDNRNKRSDLYRIQFPPFII